MCTMLVCQIQIITSMCVTLSVGVVAIAKANETLPLRQNAHTHTHTHTQGHPYICMWTDSNTCALSVNMHMYTINNLLASLAAL